MTHHWSRGNQGWSCELGSTLGLNTYERAQGESTLIDTKDTYCRWIQNLNTSEMGSGNKIVSGVNTHNILIIYSGLYATIMINHIFSQIQKMVGLFPNKTRLT